jgi:hypothetical protein
MEVFHLLSKKYPKSNKSIDIEIYLMMVPCAIYYGQILPNKSRDINHLQEELDFHGEATKLINSYILTI